MSSDKTTGRAGRSKLEDFDDGPGDRAKPSKVRDSGPTAAELAASARRLKWQLDSIVKSLDALSERGKSDAEAWEAIRIIERRFSKPGASRVAGAIQAIRTYAESSHIDQFRLFRAIAIAVLALEYVRGSRLPGEVVAMANDARGDGALDVDNTSSAMKRRTGSARTEKTKWRSVYTALAWDADVWPAPDTARGNRSEGLVRLYRTAVLELEQRERNRARRECDTES